MVHQIKIFEIQRLLFAKRITPNGQVVAELHVLADDEVTHIELVLAKDSPFIDEFEARLSAWKKAT